MAHRLSQTRSPRLDSEDWEIVFQAYEAYPILAFILAQHLDYLRDLIEQKNDRESAVFGLDLAIEALQPLTNFRNTELSIYLSAVAGTLTPERKR